MSKKVTSAKSDIAFYRGWLEVVRGGAVSMVLKIRDIRIDVWKGKITFTSVNIEKDLSK